MAAPPATLLSLPTEIRLDIFDYLLAQRPQVRPSAPIDYYEYAFPPAILLVNRQLNTEAKTVLCGKNHYHYHVLHHMDLTLPQQYSLESHLLPLEQSPIPLRLPPLAVLHIHLLLPVGYNTYCFEVDEPLVDIRLGMIKGATIGWPVCISVEGRECAQMLEHVGKWFATTDEQWNRGARVSPVVPLWRR